MYEINTIRLKFTNNYMVCVSLPNNKFKYFNLKNYGSLVAAQKNARMYVNKLNHIKLNRNNTC